MPIETGTYQDVAKATVIRSESEQTQADRALARLDKADAELATLLDRLAVRLRPVTHLGDMYEDGPSQASEPSMRSPLVAAIDVMADRISARARMVVEITDGLDV